MEEFVTLQKYASLHRLSTHAVIKKTMNGELKTLVKKENGKEVTYIVLESDKAKTNIQQSAREEESDDTAIDYRKEYEQLHREYLILKTKYEKLLER